MDTSSVDEQGAGGAGAGSSRRLFLVLTAGYAVVVALQLFGLLGREPYDDSYFFKRFAYNFLEHGMLAWNVSDGPVHGNTSQLFQLVGIGIMAVAPDHYMVATRVLMGLCLIAAYACMLRLAARNRSELLPTLAMCSIPVLFTMISGMETPLVLLGLSVFLLLLHCRQPPWGHWAAVPLCIVVLYLLRPDSILLTGTAFAWHHLVGQRRIPWKEGILLAAALGATLLLLALYYGSAFPLSFYLKSSFLSVYDDAFIAMSHDEKRTHALFFGVMALPLLYVALHRLDRRSLGPLAAAAVFVLYHWVSTVEIMGMHARFYVPALPFVTAAAMSSPRAQRGRVLVHLGFLVAYTALVAMLVRKGMLPISKGWILAQVPVAMYVGYVASTWGLVLAARGYRRLAPAVVLVATAAALWVGHPFDVSRLPKDEAYLALHRSHCTSYRGLEPLVQCIGSDITVYHSEIGLPGITFLDGKVTDLVGLMNPEFVFEGMPFDAYCSRDQPEAIFLPHSNYRRLNQEIMASQCLRGYTRMVEHSSSPLYLRKDLVRAYRQCARAAR